MRDENQYGIGLGTVPLSYATSEEGDDVSCIAEVVCRYSYEMAFYDALHKEGDDKFQS